MPETVTTRRTRRTVTVLAAVAVLIAAAGWLWFGRDGGTAPAELGTRTATAGPVEVTLTALSLDSDGARFRIVLDTHTVELDADLPSAARLRIDGRTAGRGSWDGDGPGGHHREGTLTVATPVPSGAIVELRLTDLPGTVSATWTAP